MFKVHVLSYHAKNEEAGVNKTKTDHGFLKQGGIIFQNMKINDMIFCEISFNIYYITFE